MLRVTIDLIPRGIEQDKRKFADITISNDGTGTPELGNYIIRAEGETAGGWDSWDGTPLRMVAVDRSVGYLHIVRNAIDRLAAYTPRGQAEP